MLKDPNYVHKSLLWKKSRQGISEHLRYSLQISRASFFCMLSHVTDLITCSQALLLNLSRQLQQVRCLKIINSTATSEKNSFVLLFEFCPDETYIFIMFRRYKKTARWYPDQPIKKNNFIAQLKLTRRAPRAAHFDCRIHFWDHTFTKTYHWIILVVSFLSSWNMFNHCT